MVEHAGGNLSLLATPSHGKPGTVRVTGGDLFAGLPAEFTAGRYHSLHATPDQVGGGFTVTAVTADPGREPGRTPARDRDGDRGSGRAPVGRPVPS